MEEHKLVWFCKKINVNPKFMPPDYLLFLFNQKPSVWIFRADDDTDEIWELKKHRYFLLTHIIKKFRFYYNQKALILSDKKFSKDIKLPDYLKIDNQKLGKFLGYPDCCINQFEKDFIAEPDGESVVCYQSAKRYLNQLQEMKIKDPFGITINKNKKVEFDFIAFIPCSPKCKEALKLLEEYKLILKFLEEGINKNGIII